ncbi:MAG: hypothetical protein EXR98_09910 [Gemmataceae bacterium]|nr:hypothetical protein [Gemmataceae bacterium]
MGADGGFDFLIYGFALIGAAIGGTTGYLIANAVPAMEDLRLRKLEDFDKYEEEPDDGIRNRRRHSDPGDGSFEDGTGR